MRAMGHRPLLRKNSWMAGAGDGEGVGNANGDSDAGEDGGEEMRPLNSRSQRSLIEQAFAGATEEEVKSTLT